MAEDLTKLVAEINTGIQELRTNDAARAAELAKTGTDLSERKVRDEKITIDVEKALTRLSTVEAKMNRPDGGASVLAPDTKEHMGRLIRALVHKQPFATKDAEWLSAKTVGVLGPNEEKSLITGNDVSAGYIVLPPEQSADVIKDIVEISPIRADAHVRAIGTRDWEAVRRTGSNAASWEGEEDSVSDGSSSVTFAKEKIPCHRLTARVDLTRTQIEDSMFDLEAYLREDAVEQFALAEGTSFVSGDGKGQAEGFTVRSGIDSTNSGDADLLTADGIKTLFFSLKSGYWGRAKWYCLQATVAAIAKLKDGNGDYLLDLAGGLRNSPVLSLLGHPIVMCPDIEGVSAGNYPLYWGDMRAAFTVVDRIGMTIQVDPFTSTATDVIRMFWRRRCGGQVVQTEPLKKQLIGA